MNRAELAWMLDELTDKATVIRGYAQMALECEHPNWSKQYINSIIRQIDKLSALNKVIATLYLNGDEHYDDDNYNSGCKSTTLNNLLSRDKYH